MIAPDTKFMRVDIELPSEVHKKLFQTSEELELPVSTLIQSAIVDNFGDAEDKEGA